MPLIEQSSGWLTVVMNDGVAAESWMIRINPGRNIFAEIALITYIDPGPGLGAPLR